MLEILTFDFRPPWMYFGDQTGDVRTQVARLALFVATLRQKVKFSSLLVIGNDEQNIGLNLLRQ